MILIGKDFGRSVDFPADLCFCRTEPMEFVQSPEIWLDGKKGESLPAHGLSLVISSILKEIPSGGQSGE